MAHVELNREIRAPEGHHRGSASLLELGDLVLRLLDLAPISEESRLAVCRSVRLGDPPFLTQLPAPLPALHRCKQIPHAGMRLL